MMELTVARRYQRFLKLLTAKEPVYNKMVGNYDRKEKQEGGLMNLTIPIRAKNSTSSWSRQLRGISSRKSLRTDRKRYVFSMITAVLLVGTLIVGSVGGMVHVAAARDNFSSRNYNYYTPGSNQNHGYTGSYNSRTQTNTPATSKTAPSQNKTSTSSPTKVTPTVQPAAPAPTTTQVAPKTETTATVTPQIVAETPAPKPVDTAPEIASMTTAQADKNTQAVTYTSGKLSEDTRNRILIMAGVAAITGGLLYTMSFIGAAAPVGSKREIPIRYIVPVREVITS